MKRLFGISAILASFISLVSAAYYGDVASGLEYGMTQLIHIVESLFYPISVVFFGGYDNLLFERVLVLIILLSIIYVVVSKMDLFKDNKPIIWIVTISVSLLATRFMTEELLNNIILPYTVFGVALTGILPMIIYFTFVQSFESVTIRKTLWIFFIVVFIGIWDSRYTDLGGISWIYFFTGVVALIFLLLDGTIRRMMINQRMKELDIDNRAKFSTEIRRQLKEVNTDYREGFMNEVRYKKVVKRLNDQLDDLRKN